MITIFSTPKPFKGHIGVIQRNALGSWKQLHPDVDIILFGDEEGAAEAAREFDFRHEPFVERAESGTPYLNSLFERAQQMATHDVVCYVNCDIILTSGFLQSIEQIRRLKRSFLIVGYRWDLDITEPLDFARPDWEQQLMTTVCERGRRRVETLIDYFVFPRGFYRQMAPLVVARFYWDNWLLWKARSEGAMLVDISPVFRAVHQDHAHYHPNGDKAMSEDPLAKQNLRLVGGGAHLLNLGDAEYMLTERGLVHDYKRYFRPLKRLYRRITWQHTWVPLMDLTRPLRHRLGIRQRSASELRDR